MSLDLTRGYEEIASERAVFDAIRTGMEPFQPRPIDLYMDFDLDFLTHRLMVDFPSIHLSFKMHLDRDLLLNEPFQELSASVGRDLFNIIRYRATAPIPSNIELGEN